MAINYNGDGTATQAPSPAWGPNVTPIAELPEDGDALNVASVYQSLKMHTDGLDYLVNAPHIYQQPDPDNYGRMAQWTNSEGVPASGIDHLGFQGAGRWHEVKEGWIRESGPFSFGSVFESEMWFSQFTSGSNQINFDDIVATNSSGMAMVAETGDPADKILVHTIADAFVFRADSYAWIEMLACPTVAPIAAQAIACGFSELPNIADAIIATNRDYAMLYNPGTAGDGQKWRGQTSNAATGSGTAVIGLAAVANQYFTLRVEIYGSSTPYGAQTLFYVNGTAATAVTTNQPAAGSRMRPMFKIYGTAAVAETFLFGPIRWGHTLLGAAQYL